MPKTTKVRSHPILSMAMANLDAWVHSPRTIFMLIFTILLCYLEVYKLMVQVNGNGWAMNLAETPYKFLEYGVNIYMSSILVFVMISELPRKLPYQNYMLIRSNRKKWMTAQILYSFLIVIAVLLLILLCILLFSALYTDFGSGWTDPARIASGSMQAEHALVPQYVREHFVPFTAIFYAALPLFFFWFSLAMIILLCSLLGSQQAGLIICAFALLAHFVGAYDTLFYPVKYATISGLSLEEFGPERYWYTLAGYIILNATMILTMYWRVSRTDLVFYSENKI